MQKDVPTGPELRKLRLAAGVSATQVARLMGVAQPTVSHLESGQYRPRPGTVLRYMTALLQAQAEQEARRATFREELVLLVGRAAS